MSQDEIPDEIPDGLEEKVYETTPPPARTQLPAADPAIVNLQLINNLSRDLVAWRALATRMADMNKTVVALIQAGKPVTSFDLPPLPHLELNVPVNGTHQPDEPSNGRISRVGIEFRNMDRLTPQEVSALLTILYNYGVRAFKSKKAELDAAYLQLAPEKLEIAT